MKKRADTTSGSRTGAGTRYLMTAASGRQVWVPADRLEQWKKGQEAVKAGKADVSGTVERAMRELGRT